MKRTMLHAGWLTKSPPDRKTQGAWKIFKSQWRRRYFVLSSKNVSNTLPGSCPAELEYFESDKQVRRKGRINLDNCEKVVIHMESEYYKHVFVIKTTDRGHNRTYYLAADNEMDMERWVEQLRSVLNLQDEGHVPFSTHLNTRSNIQPKTLPQDLQRNQSIASSVDTTMSPLSGVSVLFGSPLLNEDYLPIDQCSSGPPILTPRLAPTSVRVVTIKSPPPVSPGSLGSSQYSGSSDKYYNLPGGDSVTDDDVYNYPKPYNRDSDIYKLPASHDNFGRPRDSDIYKVPPARNGSGHNFTYDQQSSCEGSRDSNYDYPPPLGGGSVDRDSNYDYPPGAVPAQYDKDDDCVRPLWECESRTAPDLQDDTYDIVPPRSHSQQLPNGANFSSLPPAPRPPTNLDDVYDIPGRPGGPIAPPKGHRMPLPNVHRYINAAPTPVVRGQVRSQLRGSRDEALYLPMSGDAANDVYLPMNQMEKIVSQPHNPAKRNVGTLPPPPPAPHAFGARSSGEVVQKAPMTLPRSSERTSDRSDQGSFDQHHSLVDSFRGTQRTRSFKRNIPPPCHDISLPMKKSGNDDSSSDDEDDEESVGSSPKLEYMNLQNVGSDLESPAVSPPPKPVVQYLDLDLDGASPMVTSSTSTASSETPNKVEYNEIDMEKTKALFDAKLMLEKERKGSEKSDL